MIIEEMDEQVIDNPNAPEVNHSLVEMLKQQIKSGQYDIDYQRIAEKMITT